MTPSSTLMLASMISVFHLGIITLVTRGSLYVAVFSFHIVEFAIICKSGVELVSGKNFILISSIP